MAELHAFSAPLDAATPHVLIEAAEWRERQAFEQVLTASGYAVSSCPGPEGADRRCTMAAASSCAGAEHADVIVYLLRYSDARNREALRSVRRRLPDTPVIVGVPEAVVQRNVADFEGAIVLDTPFTAESLVAAVNEALGDRGRPPS